MVSKEIVMYWFLTNGDIDEVKNCLIRGESITLDPDFEKEVRAGFEKIKAQPNCEQLFPKISSFDSLIKAATKILDEATTP